MMRDRVDIVVVGGGVIGSSIAYHLTVRGLAVQVLDSGAPLADGAGTLRPRSSTCRATGGFRAQFATRVNVELSMLSRTKLQAFSDETGGDAGYEPVGYLFCANDARALDGLLAAQRVQHAVGLTEARPVSVSDIETLNPAITTEDLVGGVFCPSDGYIRPMGLLQGYRAAAERRGASFRDGVACTGFRMEERGGDTRVTGVRTSAGDIACATVVNAAGPWAASVSAMAGFDLPVTPLRRNVALTEPTGALPPDMPMTIMTGDGFHFRVRDGRVLLLWPDSPEQADPFAMSVDAAWMAEVRRRADARVPALAAVPIDSSRSWSGLYEMSPDDHLILGATPAVSNMCLANGSSGHGVMHSPAIGQLVAEIVCDGAAVAIDASALGASRFAAGASLHAPVLL